MSSQRTQRDNSETLTGLAQRNEYQRSIAAWREGEHKAFNWLTRTIRRIRQRGQVQSRELELFRDAFEFETGLDSQGKGKQAFEAAARAHIQRAAEHQQRRLANEALAGSIDDFADHGSMGDEPDFEAEVLKQHPELKAHKK